MIQEIKNGWEQANKYLAERNASIWQFIPGIIFILIVLTALVF
jgi:hypothetical protein